MSAFTPYQAFPNPAPATPAAPPPVYVAAAGPVPQSRATVAFRLLLAIPHFFVLYFVGIAAGIIAFIGWWGALFTGRLPEFAATFLTGCLRWQTRVSAYMMLLTDAYPPFSLDDDPDYPVRVTVPAGQPLNPLAVLFRLILAIPAAIVAALVVVGGGTIVSFIAWLITLVSGQLPAALHQAYNAVLRYHIRYVGYWWMLTAAYPSGLFGDTPGMPGWTSPAWPDATQPGMPQYGYGSAASVYGTPGGYPAAPGWAQPAEPLASFPLSLSASARRLVRTFMALGVLTYVGYLVIPFALLAAAGPGTVQVSGNALAAMNTSYATLTGNLTGWQHAVQACDGNLSCVTKQDAKAATYFAAFDNRLTATPVPGNAVTAQARLSADAAAATRDFTQLSEARDVAGYQTTFARTGLQQTLTKFDRDYATFVQALLNF